MNNTVREHKLILMYAIGLELADMGLSRPSIKAAKGMYPKADKELINEFLRAWK